MQDKAIMAFVDALNVNTTLQTFVLNIHHRAMHQLSPAAFNMILSMQKRRFWVDILMESLGLMVMVKHGNFQIAT